VSIAALAGVAPQEAGLASGLLNTSQQIGGAIGVALVTTIFTSATSGKHPHSQREALGFLTTGFQHGFWALLALALAGAVAAAVLLHGMTAEDVTEHEAAGVAI
jgi:sugar phosphate permease